MTKSELDLARVYLHKSKHIINQLEVLETEILQDKPDLDRIKKILFGNWSK